jgi:hypothetical protein
MEVKLRFVYAVFVVGAVLGGCAPKNQFAGMAPEEIRVASDKIETPAQVSTVQFKELGDTKRGAVMQRIIHDVWGESCQPFAIVPNGYSPNGASQWSVRCVGTVLAKDYEVALPERAEGKARALRCFKSGATQLTCNIVGHLPGQEQAPAQPMTEAPVAVR